LAIMTSVCQKVGESWHVSALRALQQVDSIVSIYNSNQFP